MKAPKSFSKSFSKKLVLLFIVCTFEEMEINYDNIQPRA